MKSIRAITLILLLIMVFVSLDFGLNFLWSLVPEANNDGMGNFSILHGLFRVFGDHSWSYSRYLNAFQSSVWTTFVLLIVNAALAFWEKKD